VNEKNIMSQCKSGLVLLPLVILIIYGNTFNASWHFDDYHNIVDNPRLHLKLLNTDTLLQTFCASYDHGYYNSQKIYRPLTNLTFALNWLVGQDHVAGYHIVNLMIHIMTAIFLFLTISSLFKTPHLKDTYNGGNVYFIALLAAVLWGIHPIQTQAVTYIVQRAASMAALFYIMGLFFYLTGRLETHKVKSFLYFGACLLFFSLALASKQNTATFPIALLLLELTFFQDLSNKKTIKRLGIIIPVIGIVVIGFGIAVFMKGNWVTFLQGYTTRPFSLMERLLTEPRIVVMYLSQLFLPSASRLSFLHDIGLSTSLVNPLSTLPAVLFIFLLILLAFLYIRKYPLFSFAAIFFFLNHIIESSIIPLELVYEHRNYLPSLFLFLPVALLIQKGIDRYPDRPLVKYLIIIVMTWGITYMGIETCKRNHVFKNEKLFWEDAIHKAPALARPYHNLALYHYSREGNNQMAFHLYNVALTLKYPERNDLKANTFNNMGNIFSNQNMFDEAIAMYREAIAIYPEYNTAKVNLMINDMYVNKFDEASLIADELLKKRPGNKTYLDLKGLILLRQNQIDEAISFFKQALLKDSGFKKSFANLGTALSLKGEYRQADFFLNRALLLAPDDMAIHLRRIENSILANHEKNRNRYIKELLETFTLQQIMNSIAVEETNDIIYPLKKDMLLLSIKNAVSMYFYDVSGKGRPDAIKTD